ncbi:flagellar biosynthesis protein [Actibacterium sp. 188UL27-1]|uniref:flagellar biosynthesis protein n=1 Tax=Actibacterium sp. 188UL27-1 TaxID=2786961 RepID=UPI00195871F0|nr:flagellar biosynthesis protein [Actibacterium sp. 188UL27-1]MBM7066223.1 flagellar biosynthesis protein [Actibacterium sp. 188UL27-1]
MTLRAVILENFDTTKPAPKAAFAANQGEPKEQWLDVFERGYKDGWDDAIKASEAEQDRIGVELSGNLADLGFTYQEARAAVLKEMRPLLEGLLSKVLPASTRDLLNHRLLDELAELADKAAHVTPRIVIAPANRSLIEGLLADQTALPVVIEEEPSLGEGQAYFQFGASEQKIDLDAAFESLSAIISDFFDHIAEPQEKAYG